jgi:Ca2+/Na+ antiporter
VSVWVVLGLVTGVGCLVAGAELLVKGAAAIATELGVQPVVIGYLVLDQSNSTAADVVAPTALIAAPLVLMTFAVTGYRGWQHHRSFEQPDAHDRALT